MAPSGLGQGKCVLVDFDGPVCALYADHSLAGVRDEFAAWLDACGLRVLHDPRDPYGTLRNAGWALPGHALVARMHRRLAREELAAVDRAEATPGFAELIEALADQGSAVAVTTNNSAAAVRRYLRRVGLARHFGPHIYGRSADPCLMKPDPDCLHRALAGIGAAAKDALMIGDTADDCTAARRAGVPFLGYAHRGHNAERMRAAGAVHIVSEMRDVLKVTAGR